MRSTFGKGAVLPAVALLLASGAALAHIHLSIPAPVVRSGVPSHLVPGGRTRQTTYVVDSCTTSPTTVAATAPPNNPTVKPRKPPSGNRCDVVGPGESCITVTVSSAGGISGTVQDVYLEILEDLPSGLSVCDPSATFNETLKGGVLNKPIRIGAFSDTISTKIHFQPDSSGSTRTDHVHAYTIADPFGKNSDEITVH